jgi:nucleoside-triphosphatase THEP1
MAGADVGSEKQMTVAVAAAVYIPKQADKSALLEFVTRLKGDQVSVAGILQESRLDPGAETRTIESVDISTGHRIPIKRPMANDLECGLDVANLVETSAILREAVRARPDLVVIEKFGDQEQMGEGLLDEIMQIIVEGIPLLIAVPEPALWIWRRQCGGLGATLPYTEDAMREWWRKLSNG